jgi:hypothetical protein
MKGKNIIAIIVGKWYTIKYKAVQMVQLVSKEVMDCLH